MAYENREGHVRADEVRPGDELHLALTGSDEYVTVTSVEEAKPERIRFVFAPWPGPAAAVVPATQQIQVRN